MTIRYAIRETETHPGKFPNGLDTSVEDIYAAQGEGFHNPPQAWALTVLSPYSDELPKVTAYRTRASAKAAMEADIKETLDADDPTFDAEAVSGVSDALAAIIDVAMKMQGICRRAKKDMKRLGNLYWSRLDNWDAMRRAI